MSERAAPFDLRGRKAVVTGASRGIGAAIAQGLAGAGAEVLGLSRSGGTDNAGIVHKRCDLTDSAAVSAVFDDLARQWTSLDVLVNSAGISIPPGDVRNELDRMRRTLETNVVAVYAAVLAARLLLTKSGRGSIINVTSINSVRGFPGNPGYVAAKAALSGLTRALAVDLAREGIRVNALAPGYVHTAMTAESFSDPVLNAQRSRHTILGRWGEPADLAGAAIFLAGDASTYVTGQELFIDGGWTANGLVALERDTS